MVYIIVVNLKKIFVLVDEKCIGRDMYEILNLGSKYGFELGYLGIIFNNYSLLFILFI